MSDPLAALRAVSGNDPSSGATTLPNIPAVPYTDDASLTNILSAMKLWMDKAAGSGLTGFASKQDLIDAGVLTKDPSGNIKPTADTSMAIPPVPTGLTASGAMTIILLEWDDPRLAYGNHGYTEIWAAEVDNFSSAQLVGQSSGVIFVHAVGEGSQRYYWIRFVSTAGVMGPYNAVGGTLGQTAQNPAYLLDAMSGILDEQPFFTVETPTEINGVTIPAGTYMKTAFIADASINNAKIGSLSADKITTGTLAAGRIASNSITADKINATNLNVVNGTFSGELLGANGTFSGALAAATGTFAGSLLAGVIDATSFAGESHAYSTPGNYSVTVPAGKTTMRVTVIGGGGGGGGGGGRQDNGAFAGGGGGGGGAGTSVTGTYTMTAGATVNITVGAGGAGGGAGAWFGSGAGSSGSASSISASGLATISASGGGGGGGGCAPGSSYGSSSLGGSGGSIGGQAGTAGYSNYRGDPTGACLGGAGGSSAYGSGGPMTGPNAAGSNGTRGGGGSGGGGETGLGWVNNAGGSGGNGYVLIEFFNPNSVVLMTAFQNLVAKYNALAAAMGRTDLQYSS